MFTAPILSRWPLFRDFFGGYYPAMALFEISRFFEEQALIEIEGLAVINEELDKDDNIAS